ncbi:MAG TPA: MFS transporter, partial [Burkholderiaceae bacterium]|nr:MFS transporter [Burkholderiaceae bacterium]
GQRREGAFAACQSWMSKVGIALGMFASGWILQFSGFDSRPDAVQSPETLTTIRLLLSGIPATGLVIAMLVMLRFPLDAAGMQSIRHDLEARRGTV